MHDFAGDASSANRNHAVFIAETALIGGDERKRRLVRASILVEILPTRSAVAEKRTHVKSSFTSTGYPPL